MAHDQSLISAFYRKLLTFYPQGFKEQLGESMEQTFNDLYNERRQFQTGLLNFTIRMFTETAIGIAREHILLITEIDPMKNVLTNIKSPALISLLLVIPFMIMEVVNTRNLNAIFNVPLFGFLWILPMIFIALLMPIVRNLRQAGNSLMANPVGLLLRIVFLLLIAWMWASLLIDQMPCFLGVPNCD
jgi:hypothetical protein